MKQGFVYLLMLIWLSCPAALRSDQDPSRCLYDLEVGFFVPDLVFTALSLYQIPQGLWNAINGDLQQKSLEMPQRMKKKTARMVPNPIQYPIDKKKARVLLRQELFDAFDEVMRDNLVKEQAVIYGDRAVIFGMFNYVYRQQENKFTQCFGKEEQKEES